VLVKVKNHWLKVKTLSKYFRSVNYHSAALILQRSEDKVIPNIVAINSTEGKTIRN